MNDKIKIIYNNLYANNLEKSLSIIKENIVYFKKCEDNILEHPFCHEIAHQALVNITRNYNDDFMEKHKIRVAIFKIIWDSSLKRNILNDIKYKDKYGLTAIQRLLITIPRKKIDESNIHILYSIDYDKIDTELAEWIKTNLENRYRMNFNPIDKRNFGLPRENEEIYGIEYYGQVTIEGEKKISPWLQDKEIKEIKSKIVKPDIELNKDTHTNLDNNKSTESIFCIIS